MKNKIYRFFGIKTKKETEELKKRLQIQLNTSGICITCGVDHRVYGQTKKSFICYRCKNGPYT